ncbi:MAG: hypothetical protein KKH98_00850 [Spirochaetes bacterium]|nr:hypothetical protein [Spirochaetota bacterium]
MKKCFLICLVFAITLSSHAYSGSIMGMYGGYNFLLNDLPEGVLEDSRGGISFIGKVGYEFPGITVGLLSGYLPMYYYEIITRPAVTYILFGYTFSIVEERKKFSAYDIPVVAFVQYGTEGPYGLAGMGAHIIYSRVDYSTGFYADEETKAYLGFTLGGGYVLKYKKIGLDIGSLFNIILKKNETLSMILLKAGFSFDF